MDLRPVRTLLTDQSDMRSVLAVRTIRYLYPLWFENDSFRGPALLFVGPLPANPTVACDTYVGCLSGHTWLLLASRK